MAHISYKLSEPSLMEFETLTKWQQFNDFIIIFIKLKPSNTALTFIDLLTGKHSLEIQKVYNSNISTQIFYELIKISF